MATYPATAEEIKRMLRNSDGNRFEILRSSNQNLTFNEAEKVFKAHELPFKSKFRNLGLIQEKTDLFTNLALLISDQNPYTFKVAVFNNLSNTNFISRKEFTGSILKQLQEIVEYISLLNRFDFNIKDWQREEKYDYPEFAIREAVLNALIHRDYDLESSNIVNINQEEIEIISLGGIVNGLEVNDILNGISITRNPNLANIMFRLEFIESFGTGLRRIFDLYSETEKIPKLNITPNSFKLSLPNQNRNKRENKRDAQLTQSFEDETLKKIVHFIDVHKEVTGNQLIKDLNLKRSTFYKKIKILIDSGKVKFQKVGNKRIYSLVSP